NKPFDLEYASTGDFRSTSVEADASRPTGPAATAASTPSFTLPSSRPLKPSRLVNTRTRSVACTPSCSPKLPPPIFINEGGLHLPLSIRCDTSPLPYSPPRPNAPL